MPRLINAATDFPDTNNTQNFMDNGPCANMFTKGQVQRMRAALHNPATMRSNLVKHQNLFETGVWLDTIGTVTPRPDPGPLADFQVSQFFVPTSRATTLLNRSWRDTITDVEWIVPTGIPSSATSFNSVMIRPTQPGWLPITLKANATINGLPVSHTITKSNAVYVADTAATNAQGYFQEFNTGTGSDVDQFPIFNYFPSTYKWELNNTAGYYDNTSVCFRNADPRPIAMASNMTLTPTGLYADFFTKCFDISGTEFSPKAFLTFFSAGAFRVTNPNFKNDSLVISYSTDLATNWTRLGALKKDDLANNGFIASPFYPQNAAEWKLQGFQLPLASKQRRVFFRFRFYPGTDNGAINNYDWGTGNHFYIDRLHITGNAVGVDEFKQSNSVVTIWPNPTSGSATINLQHINGQAALIAVNDITGKLVYQTKVINTGSGAHQVEVSKEVLSAKGVYMVRVTDGAVSTINKLVVY